MDLRILASLLLCCVVASAIREENNTRHAKHEKHHEKHHEHKQHAHQKHKHAQHQHNAKEKHHSRHHSHPLHLLHKEGKPIKDCSWVCVPNEKTLDGNVTNAGNSSVPVENTTVSGFTPAPSGNASISANSSAGLQILFNGKNKLLAVFNSLSSTSVIFDYSFNIISLFNGTSGLTIVVDINAKVVYRISSNSSNGENESPLWLSSKSSFQSYFDKTTSLEILLKFSKEHGDKYDINNIPQAVLNEIVLEIGSLGVSVGRLKEFDKILKILIDFLGLLRGPLGNFYKGQGSFAIPNGFDWFAGINSAFGQLLGDLPFAINPQIDLGSIFSSASGAEVLINLLVEIGKQTDLSKLASGFNLQKLLDILSKISDGSNNVDSFFGFIAKLSGAVSGQSPFDLVFGSIFTLNSTTFNSSTFHEIINKILGLIESQSQKFNNAAAFGQLKSILEALKGNGLVINNINISEILTVVINGGPQNGISTIIKILSRLSPAQTIPQFFKFIVNLLNNNRSSGELSKLFPWLDPSVIENLTKNSQNVLQNILQGRNISSLLAGNPNITGVLSQIPIFGDIAKQFASALGSGGDLSKYLNPSDLIKAFEGIPQIPLKIFGTFSNITSGVVHGIESGIQHGVEIIGGILGHSTEKPTETPPNSNYTEANITTLLTGTGSTIRADTGSTPTTKSGLEIIPDAIKQVFNVSTEQKKKPKHGNSNQSHHKKQS